MAETPADPASGPQSNPVSADVQRRLSPQVAPVEPTSAPVADSKTTPYQNPGYSRQDHADAGSTHVKAASKAKKKPDSFGATGSSLAFLFFSPRSSSAWFHRSISTFIPRRRIGTVVGYHTHHLKACGGLGYDPVVTFLVGHGGSVTATLSNKQFCNAPSDGATFDVRYDTRNPSSAEITGASNFAAPIVGALFGLFFTALGVGMFR